MQFAADHPVAAAVGDRLPGGHRRHLPVHGAPLHAHDAAVRPRAAGTTSPSASGGFYALLLVLLTGMLGVFVSLDLFLFYVFWEVMLIPMYFIIGIWGGTEPALRRHQVLHLHDGRLAADAGGDPVHRLDGGRGHRRAGLLLRARARQRRGGREGRALAVRRVRAGLRHQGAGLPLPHLAPRRPRAKRPPPARSSWPACCSRWGPTASCGSPSRSFPGSPSAPSSRRWP